MSAGDEVTASERGDAAIAVGAVAVDDVVGEGMSGGVPVEVVGVVEHELLDRAEVCLDAVEVAGVGWGGDQLDPVVGGEGADVGRMSGVRWPRGCPGPSK